MIAWLAKVMVKGDDGEREAGRPSQRAFRRMTRQFNQGAGGETRPDQSRADDCCVDHAKTRRFVGMSETRNVDHVALAILRTQAGQASLGMGIGEVRGGNGRRPDQVQNEGEAKQGKECVSSNGGRGRRFGRRMKSSSQ